MAGKRLSKEQTEYLIDLVREKPYLYDVRDSRHCDSTLVANTWRGITEKMGLQEKGTTSVCFTFHYFALNLSRLFFISSSL